MRTTKQPYLFSVLTKIMAGCIVAIAVVYPASAQTHPMDGLTPDEIRAAVALVKQENIASVGANFAQIHLIEPDKPTMMRWLETAKRNTLPPRRARLVLRDGGKTKEVLVDLSANKVEQSTLIDQGLPIITQAEWEVASDLALNDPRIQALIKRAGISNLEDVSCAASSPGIVSDILQDVPDATSRRLLRVLCFYDSLSTHPFGVPLEGFHALVDADKMKIIKIVQSDIVPAPSPEKLRERQTDRLGNTELQPIFQGAPRQPNFKITNRFEVEWFRWKFHIRLDQRVGPIVSLVRFNDDTRDRMVAYQISLSDMYVPYQDPDANWNHRTYLDNAELGLGYLASELAQGQDCPLVSAYLSFNLGSTSGDVTSARNAICIFERNTGNPEFRHVGAKGVSLMQTELVVRSIPTVGNYDYVIDTIFTASGRIKVRVGSTGIDAVKTVRTRHMDDATARKDTAHGALVAPHTAAILHDHYFSFRVDLDIDGPANQFVKAEVKVQPGPEGSFRDFWSIEERPFAKEGPILPNGKRGAFIVQNNESKNQLGQLRGYQIMSAHAMPSPLSLKDEAQKRAAFAKAPLWVTRHNPQERYASGNYALQHLGIVGLPAYSGDKQSIDQRDLVLWPTIGFHHFTRVEDWPFLSTMWRGFDLMPYGFFNLNPAMSLVRPEPR